jgi:hypothetical protein
LLEHSASEAIRSMLRVSRSVGIGESAHEYS